MATITFVYRYIDMCTCFLHDYYIGISMWKIGTKDGHGPNVCLYGYFKVFSRLNEYV